MIVQQRRVPSSTPGVSLNALDWTDATVTDAARGATDVDRPPVLLVHGLASNARLWDGVAADLAARGHRVVAIDQRGHGLSDKPDEGYDFETIGNDLAAVLDAFEWDAAVIVGQSWGGNVAIEFAIDNHDRTLVSIGIDGGYIELSRRVSTWEQAVEVLSPPHLEGLPAERMEAAMRAANPDWSDIAIEGAMACFEVRSDGTIAPRLTRHRHLEILRHLWPHKAIERLHHVRRPVVFIPAASAIDDEWTIAKRSMLEELAPLDNVEIRWMTGVHDLHAQQPAAVAEHIADVAARTTR